MDGKTAAVQMRDITKSFGSVLANDRVWLDIYKGEILALLGENGSGKTTLMNMLAGIYFPDAGQIYVDGREVVIRSPRDAFGLGIGMIHQHFKLVDVLTAAENIILGLPGKERLDIKAVAARVREISEKYGFEIDPMQKVYDMSVSQKQAVEIVKVLYRGADILILDEPTVGLDPIQVVEIRDLIKSLGKKHTVILSSHILSEVQNMCDEILIISRGKLIAYDTAENLEKMMAPKTTIEVLTDAEEEESREVISGIEGIEGAEYEPAENGLTKIRIETTPEEEFGIRKVLSLRLAKIERTVLKMDIVKANLEEIFLELTNPEETDKDQLSGDISWAEIAAMEREDESRETEAGPEIIFEADKEKEEEENRNDGSI